jgi:Flp pilus assembly protein TadD
LAELAPNAAPIHYQLGALILRKVQGQSNKETTALQQAKEELLTAVRLRPDYVEAHYGLGRTFDALGDFDGAAVQFQRTLQLQPASYEVCDALGTVLTKQGHWAEAITYFTKSTEIKPDDAYAHYHLGLALSEQGATSRASAEFQKAHDIDPRFSPPNASSCAPPR